MRVYSQFAHYVPATSQVPAISLHPHSHPVLFPAGVKQKWTCRGAPGATGEHYYEEQAAEAADREAEAEEGEGEGEGVDVEYICKRRC